MGSPAGSSGTGTGSTANIYTPKFQPQADSMLQTYLGAFGPTNQAQTLADTGANELFGAGNQVLNTAFDPQSALFNRMQGTVLDQSNVANSMAGVGNSPYGASVTANALGNFDQNWENNKLQRMISGGNEANLLFNSAPNLMTALPQQAIKDLEAYLGLGQSASLGSGQLGQMGFNQLSSGIGGIGSAIGGLGSMIGGS